MEGLLSRALTRKLFVRPLLELDAITTQVPQKHLTTTRNFVRLLDGHKAILVGAAESGERLSVDDFGLFVQSLGLTPYPYIGGAAPRTNIPVLGIVTQFDFYGFVRMN